MAKLSNIRNLAYAEAGSVSSSPQDWMRFMDTASRMYRYSFLEQLLIYAQRPEATACATLDTWNQKVGRWVNRGAKGIALIDDATQPERLRYVFDIADTHAVRGAPDPYIWQLDDRHKEWFLAYLSSTYNLPDVSSIMLALENVAEQVTDEYLEDAMDGIEQEMIGSLLATLPEEARRETFRAVFRNSIFYEVARRCGLNPESYLHESDFRGIQFFNRLGTLTVLGNAVSNLTEIILMDIGREIRAWDRENPIQGNLQKPLAKSESPVYNHFTTLKYESKDDERPEEGGLENGADVSSQGRLSVSEPGDRDGERAADREVRDAAQDLPEGEPSELVSEHAGDGQADPSPVGDRPTGERAPGAADRADGADGGRDGGSEGERSDVLDSADEQPSQPGGRDHTDGIGVQLNDEATEQDLDAAEAEIASALSLPELPTVNQQIRTIEERMAAPYEREVTVPTEVVDEILRTGGNRRGSQLRLIYNYMIEQTPEAATAYVKREYGRGGKGFTINGTDYAVWFDELGLQIAAGRSVREQALEKAFLSWDDVADRIHQLLKQGEYAPQPVLDAARGNALAEYANALAFMERDIVDDYRHILFDEAELEMFKGGFPDEVEKVSRFLDHQENVDRLVSRLRDFAAVYAENRDVMRFHYYNPTRMADTFETFAKPWTPFQAREGFAWENHDVFITQDEIDAELAGGASYENSRLAIYAHFLSTDDRKARADFLKHHYGDGGHSPALNGKDGADESHDFKGIRLRVGGYTNPAAEVTLSWAKVAQRIDYLMRNDRYLTASDHVKMPGYEREIMARRIRSFYYHTQFEKIPLSHERQAAMIQAQIDEITTAIAEEKAEQGGRYTIKQMERTRKGLEARLKKLNDQSRKDDVVTFEQLGVDRLFVDESHYYKNLFLYTKMTNVAGIQTTDAQKSSDMYLKCRYLDELTGGKGITFATGTPISNSMVELYTIMRYLQYDTLQRTGLGHFDSWASTFGETVTAIELAPEGTGYRAKTRFARFFNLPELISMFKEVADVQTADMLKLPVPEAEFVNEVLNPSEIQQDMVASFSDRAEAVRSGRVDPREDNMLRITNDGRKCALDQRLMNPLLPDDEESKVNACIRNAFKVWQDGQEERTAQVIFCDLSTPKGDGSFNVYDDIRNKLEAMGVPREEIVFIHEATTETQKAELFAKVRAGQVRVLLGSTAKLGAGTNMQDRLIALHHLDAPWKPSDLEQQEGRILRQGNMNEKVQIFRYVTEGTFDAYMWQILENKQKFISQIMTSKSPVRACEDVDDTALSYAEIKALATGNPYIKEKMDLDIQVAKLRMLRASHTSQIYRLETDIARTYPVQIASVQQRIANLEADKAAAAPVLALDKEQFEMKVSGVVYTDRKDAGNALIKACTAAKTVSQELPVGEYHGFRLSASYDTFTNNFELSVRGQGKYTIKLGADPSGNITRINNVLESFSGSLEEAKRKLATLEQQLETAKEEVAKPFPQEQELIQKEARLSELNALLNMDERGSEAALIDEEAIDAEQRTVEEQQEQSVEADEPEQDEDEPITAKSRRYQMAI